jgi:hypothetical protein
LAQIEFWDDRTIPGRGESDLGTGPKQLPEMILNTKVAKEAKKRQVETFASFASFCSIPSALFGKLFQTMSLETVLQAGRLHPMVLLDDFRPDPGI